MMPGKSMNARVQRKRRARRLLTCDDEGFVVMAIWGRVTYGKTITDASKKKIRLALFSWSKWFTSLSFIQKDVNLV